MAPQHRRVLPSHIAKGAAVTARAEIDADQAAVFFQKLWKGFKTKKEASRMRDEELILIGMKEAPPRPPDDDPVTRQTKVSLPIMLHYFAFL